MINLSNMLVLLHHPLYIYISTTNKQTNKQKMDMTNSEQDKQTNKQKMDMTNSEQDKQTNKQTNKQWT